MMMKSSGKSSSYRKLLENFKNDKFNRKGWIVMFQKDFSRLIKEAKLKIKTSSPNGPDLTKHIHEDGNEGKPQAVQETDVQQMEEGQEIPLTEEQEVNEINFPNEDLTDADLSRELMDMNEDGKDPPGSD